MHYSYPVSVLALAVLAGFAPSRAAVILTGSGGSADDPTEPFHFALTLDDTVINQNPTPLFVIFGEYLNPVISLDVTIGGVTTTYIPEESNFFYTLSSPAGASIVARGPGDSFIFTMTSYDLSGGVYQDLAANLSFFQGPLSTSGELNLDGDNFNFFLDYETVEILTVPAIPEPSHLIVGISLLAIGAVGVMRYRRK